MTAEIDMTNSAGRLVVRISATLAEFDRHLAHDRPMAGLTVARARGRHASRPLMITKAPLRAAMTMMAEQDNVAKDVAEQLGVSLSTHYTSG